MKHAYKFEISLSTALSFHRVENLTGYNERYREINAHNFLLVYDIFVDSYINVINYSQVDLFRLVDGIFNANYDTFANNETISSGKRDDLFNDLYAL